MASVIEDELRRPGLLRFGGRIQVRVVAALMMRELHTRYGRENIGYLWLILEPMMLAMMVGLLHSRHASHYGSDIKPVPLALIGYCNFMAFRGAVNRSDGVLESNSNLFYHRTITPMDLLLARSLLEVSGAFIAFLILSGLAIAVGVCDLPVRPLTYLCGVFLMSWLSFNMSMIVCGITHDRRAIGRLVHPITYIMLPLSGAFLVMQYVPPTIREILLYIPMAHIFEILRYGWFRSATLEFVDFAYIGIWIAVTMLLGLLLISVARRRIQLS